MQLFNGLLVRSTRILGVIALFLGLTASIQAQFQQGPRVVSPEVGEGRVAFRLLAPDAKKVQLTGSDIPAVGRGIDLTKGEQGIWEASIEIAPGYEPEWQPWPIPKAMFGAW